MNNPNKKNIDGDWTFKILALGAMLVTMITTPVLGADKTVCPSGCQFTNLQAALTGSVVGTVIRVGKGTYQHLSGGGTSNHFIQVSQSGVKIICADGAIFRGRRTLSDDATSTAANASGADGDRAVVMMVTGNDNLIEGCDITNSNTGGIAVVGDRNTVRGNRSYKNWLSGISVGDGGDDNVIEWNESYESVHGTGVGGGPRNSSGSTVRVDRTTYRYNYSHDNGKYRNASGVLVKSPGIAGDPDGGGNSDGSGSSKACAKNTASNTCAGWRWDSNLLFGNSDDGLDNSATGYTVADNVMGGNGPLGCRSIKVLNLTSGNTWERNVGFPNAASCPSSKDHGIEVSSTGGSIARDNVAYRIILGAGVTNGGGNLQQTLAPLDLTVPVGRPWERITTLYNRAKAIVPRLRVIPVYPGETTIITPPPPPPPCNECPDGGVLEGTECVIRYQPSPCP